MATIQLPPRLAQRLLREAERAGLGLDEYILELLTHHHDPASRAAEYIEAALMLLSRARAELEKGDARQAAEKLWGAAALAVKAYAEHREGMRLSSHGELWKYKRVLEKELGDWVYDAWAVALGMHTCFYEGWCSGDDVEKALPRIERLVKEVARHIGFRDKA